MPSRITAERRAAARLHAAMRRDFRLFLGLVWRKLGLPKPTPIQFDIARYLQRGPRRKLVMAFRGVGKSWIFSAFIAWRLWNEPDLKVLVVSASKPAADQVARFVRRLISELPVLRTLRPRAGQRDSASAFDVGPARPAKDPSLRAVGVNGQITGSRADLILADDVETQNNALTAGARARLSEQIKEFDAVLRPGGGVTFLGTPQSVETIYAALSERGYALRIWPAEAPSDPSIYQGRLAPFVSRRLAQGVEPGAPLDPDRFDGADLAARRASYGPAGYALQFLLDARQTDAARHPLRLGDLIVLELEEAQAPNRLVWAAEGPALDDLGAAAALLGLSDDRFQGPAERSADSAPFAEAVMTVDPSGRGRDETAYAVVKALNGMLYLTRSGGFEGGYEPETLAALAEIGKAAGARRCVVERDFGDGMFARLLEPAMRRAGWRAALEERGAGGRGKERRMADLLEPVMAQHRLAVDRAVVVADAAIAESAPERALFRQMTRLSRLEGALPHDDRLDALALAVRVLAPALSGDADRAAEATRARRLRADLRDVRASLRERLQGEGGLGAAAAARRARLRARRALQGSASRRRWTK
ncbi:MAG: phage terminase large subunit [Pseudomonadota bacterium]